MISIDNISVHFGGFILLNEVSVQIGDRDRIGLVGRNGAGKTTLMRILCAIQEPSSGKVVCSANSTIGYLPQQMDHMDGKTVYEEALNAFKDLLKIEKDIEKVNSDLSNRTDYESDDYLQLIDKLSELNNHFNIEGGASLHANVEKTLIGLGFKFEDMHRPTSEFSGGWRMRIELAKLLLQKPSYILLDEPTNHLDIESIQWLEDYLKTYSGAVILISHDRAFLDNITNRTIEISLSKLVDYKVPYTRFTELRKERREQELAAWGNQQKMIKETEDFIDRFRYKATKAVQVQSRIKQLDKVQRIEIEEEDNGVMNLRFPASPRSGRIVVETAGLSKSYGEKNILNQIDFKIEKGEKVAFVGKNGEGKTTLSKIIVGNLDYTGKLTIGHNVGTGYFAQNQDELLDGNKTVFETIDDIATGDVRQKMRDILGAFLFSGDDVDKKVKVLSGGERSRLSLAKMLLETHNLLVMDEPTNHLDIRSKDILKRALNDYDGTLILVSHDREFLDGLVDKVYEFKDHKIKEHLGGIYEFLQKKRLYSLAELERKNKKENIVETSDQPSDNKNYYFKKKEFERKIRGIQTKINEQEKSITKCEEQLEELNEQMNTGKHDPVIFTQYEKLQKELQIKMQDWEKYSEELTKLEEQRIYLT